MSSAATCLENREIGTVHAQGNMRSREKFEARLNADGVLSESELLTACTEELDLKSAVLDGLSDGILVHTIEGDILYYNSAAAVVYGFSREEFSDLGRYGWVPEDVAVSVGARIAALQETGFLDFESRGLTASGDVITTEVHARLVELPDFGFVVVSVIQDVTERVAAHDMIRHLAFHDTLTGLANRVLLDERLTLAMSSADRLGDIVGVVYLDLNSFKPVNDTFGHATGDRVLKTVGARLTNCVREYDTVARVGGDEFLVLFPRLSSHDELADLGRKIQESIGPPIDLDGRALSVSATIGLASYRAGEAPDELISRADHAMYRARLRGVDGWQQLGPEE
jgi:diguanylate cyclase (GGDEF)-like protein/PAS domain S-box-containing protein